MMLRILAVLLLLVTPAVAGPMVIRFDPGGGISDFVSKYSAVEESGGKIVVDGTCISACTLLLGLVDKANVCATDRGMFAFHSASAIGGVFSADGTKLAWAIYPKEVRDFLRTNGWSGPDEAHPDLIYAPATMFVQHCP